MKIAIVGSRSIRITSEDIEKIISDGDEIVSGGAVGVDQCACEYANNKGLKITEFLPEYSRYRRAAPLVRNKRIVEYADKVVVFWNGSSKGTLSVINYAKEIKKPCDVIILNDSHKT